MFLTGFDRCKKTMKQIASEGPVNLMKIDYINAMLRSALIRCFDIEITIAYRYKGLDIGIRD
jgi:hypothetical protein